MIAIFVMVAPLVVGFGLILLIARYAPNVPRHATLGSGERFDDRPEITADEFKEGLEKLPICLGGKCPLKSSTGGLQSLLFDADDGSRRSYCRFSVRPATAAR